MSRLPPPVLEERDGIVVLRDDLLPGGSKRRVLPRLLVGAEEFVFGGPAQGYAQVALAYSCRDEGKLATYFVAKRNTLHPLTAEARAAGAKIVQVPAGRLNNVQARAKAYAAFVGARFFPLGFDVPAFVDALVAEVRALPISPPPEAWCVAGSGALARALALAWPTTRVHAVRIGFEPKLAPGITLHVAPESFDEEAREPPPFPSCVNYDAKAWRFFRAHAVPGALFWNVGR